MCKTEGPLKYPVKEKAFAFVNTLKKPFESVVIGITYPFSEYFIERSKGGKVNVLEYVLEGEGEVKINGVWVRVRKGDTYILKASDEQVYRSDKKKPWKKIWINYQADYLEEFLKAYQVESGVYNVNSKPYFDTLLKIAENKVTDVESNLSIADCVHKIISIIAISGERLNDGILIKERLEAGVYSKIDLNEVAEEFHMSKSNLIRVFKKYYNVTPYEYLLGVKIENAKLLLTNTNMRIKEISERLHIVDEHYFSSLFFRRVGVSPKDFRLNVRSGKNK